MEEIPEESKTVKIKTEPIETDEVNVQEILPVDVSSIKVKSEDLFEATFPLPKLEHVFKLPTIPKVKNESTTSCTCNRNISNILNHPITSRKIFNSLQKLKSLHKLKATKRLKVNASQARSRKGKIVFKSSVKQSLMLNSSNRLPKSKNPIFIKLPLPASAKVFTPAAVTSSVSVPVPTTVMEPASVPASSSVAIPRPMPKPVTTSDRMHVRKKIPIKDGKPVYVRLKPQHSLKSRKRGFQKCKKRPDANDTFEATLSSDIIACMKSRILDNLIPKHTFDTYCSRTELSSMDPLTLYGIRLHKYANNMNEMIRVVELAVESNLMPPTDAAPPIPKLNKVISKHNTNNVNFMPKNITSFARGIGNSVPEVSSKLVRELLNQSVAAIVGLLGFETTNQSVFDVLVDVLIEFFKKAAYRLKLAFEDQERGWSTDFPNIVERVLVEMGMGGSRGLHDYYQSRVVRYVNVLEEHCETLNSHYKCLISSIQSPEEDCKNIDINIKIEPKEEIVEDENFLIQTEIKQDVE